jgi:hypothetical protein
MRSIVVYLAAQPLSENSCTSDMAHLGRRRWPVTPIWTLHCLGRLHARILFVRRLYIRFGLALASIGEIQRSLVAKKVVGS